MRETVRPWLAFVALTLVAIIGLAGLAQLKFSAFLADSVGDRLEIVAATVARDFGSAIDLGLRVEAVANGVQILERARAHDPAISGIAVFDLEGVVLQRAGETAGNVVHPRSHEAFRVVLLEDAEDDWSIEADALVRSGAVVKGGFGQPVAGVVVHYPVTEMRQQEAAIAAALSMDAILVGGLVVAIAVVGSLLMLRTVRRQPAATDRP